jgi:hypothetical protein
MTLAERHASQTVLVRTDGGIARATIAKEELAAKSNADSGDGSMAINEVT